VQTTWIERMLVRELNTLKREIAAVSDDKLLWATVPGVTNSIGNLVLHACGNLRHFVGAKLGATGYVRNRDAEFSSRNVTREDLLRQLDDTVAAVKQTLDVVRDGNLIRPYPEPVAGKYHVVTGDFLIHLAVHLGYHVGQVDYLRRTLTGTGTSVGAVGLGEMATAREASAPA